MNLSWLACFFFAYFGFGICHFWLSLNPGRLGILAGFDGCLYMCRLCIYMCLGVGRLLLFSCWWPPMALAWGGKRVAWFLAVCMYAVCKVIWRWRGLQLRYNLCCGVVGLGCVGDAGGVCWGFVWLVLRVCKFGLILVLWCVLHWLTVHSTGFFNALTWRCFYIGYSRHTVVLPLSISNWLYCMGLHRWDTVFSISPERLTNFSKICQQGNI